MASCGTFSITTPKLRSCILNNGKVVFSEKEISEIKELGKKNIPEAKICLGRIKLEQGDIKGAIRLFKTLLREYPGVSSYWLGLSYLKINQKEKAIHYLFEANVKGFINELYFKLTPYMSSKELNELENSAKYHPILYLFLGDYFYRNGMFDGALFYYQLALRYNIEDAKYKSALALYKLGNLEQAYNILVSLYRKGNLKAANYLANIFLQESQDALKGCFLLTEKFPNSYLLKRILSIKKSIFYLRESNKWFRIVNNKNALEKNRKRIALLLGERKEVLNRALLNIKISKLEKLCEEGHLWAEYILALKLTKLPASPVAISLYKRIFKLKSRATVFR